MSGDALSEAADDSTSSVGRRLRSVLQIFAVYSSRCGKLRRRPWVGVLRGLGIADRRAPPESEATLQYAVKDAQICDGEQDRPRPSSLIGGYYKREDEVESKRKGRKGKATSSLWISIFCSSFAFDELAERLAARQWSRKRARPLPVETRQAEPVTRFSGIHPTGFPFLPAGLGSSRLPI